MPKDLKNAQYSSSSSKKGVLGTLEGPCADTITSTRNGRRYSEELWEKVFSDPVINEYFNCGGIFGELGHPTDRSETDMEKIAICMPEKPKKGPDGKLYGKWDILDTPNGRILKCLCDYGYKIGISSRGDGEVNEGYDGEEVVDPDSYTLEAFDAVLLPAVKEARLSLVSEALNNKSLKVALSESFNKANSSDKKIMKETLERLNINLNDSGESKTESVNSTKAKEVGNSESAFVKNLQEALRNNRELQKSITDLNEKLSVSYAKEVRLQRSNENLQDKLNRLYPSLRVSKLLKEKLIDSQKTVETLGVKLSKMERLRESYKSRISSMQEEINSLQKDIDVKENQLSDTENEIYTLKEKLARSKENSSKAYQVLKEDYQDLRQKTLSKENSDNKKLEEALERAKKYRNMFNEVFEKYLECKANSIGIDVEQLKNSINGIKSYREIDRICEELSLQRRNISKLPFPVNLNENLNEQKVFTKSEDKSDRFSNPDDALDQTLINFLNI